MNGIILRNSVAYYRLYSMSTEDEHIVDVDQIDADCDGDAILKVKIGDFGVSRELWNCGRKVMDFAPRTADAID